MVNNGNFSLLLTSSGQEWQFTFLLTSSGHEWHLADLPADLIPLTPALTSSGQEWQLHISTDI